MTAPEGLPVLPPLKSAHSCRRCRRWLEGEWNREYGGDRNPDVLAALQRQMDTGRCDGCTASEAGELVRSAENPAGAGDVTPQQGLRFAGCEACGREMSGTRCAVAVRVIDGRTYVRLPYVKLFAGMAEHCNDCNAPVGEMHHRLCDQDRCPVPDCHSQAAFCAHQLAGWEVAR